MENPHVVLPAERPHRLAGDPPQACAVNKLQMLETLVQTSASIYPEASRDTFLTLIWLTLADLSALPHERRDAEQEAA